MPRRIPITLITLSLVLGPRLGLAQGTLLWQQTLTGTAANSNDAAVAVAVDNQGNVLTAGHTRNTGTFEDFTVAKFDRNGTPLWRRNLTATANSVDEALSVAVDNQGHVLAVGDTANPTPGGAFLDFTVAKFDR